MGIDEWKNKVFDYDDTTHLDFASKKFNDHRNEMTQKVGNTIASIDALNEGRASSFSDDAFGGLASRSCLRVGALMFLTNMFLNLGLCNGSQGVVKEIACKNGE